MHCLPLSSRSSPSSPPSSFATSPQSRTQTQSHSIGLNSCPPHPQGNSTDGAPGSGTTQFSPTYNFSLEYTRAVQTNSYSEIRSKIEDVIESEGTDTHQLRLSQVLHPNRDCVHQALSHTNPKATLTRLVSTCFDHGEKITDLCLVLWQCLSRARTLYAPITDLVQEFPRDLSSIHLSECNWAIDVFLRFDSPDNPFTCPDSPNFNEMRDSLFHLKKQLDRRLHKSHSRHRFLHRFIYSPSHLKKKRVAYMAQLKAAANGTFFHINYLETIVRLVDGLRAAVDGDRELIRIGLKSDRDIYLIHEVVKYLRKNHDNFVDRLKELEEHIYLCIIAVNKSRAKLLDQIHLHQSSNS